MTTTKRETEISTPYDTERGGTVDEDVADTTADEIAEIRTVDHNIPRVPHRIVIEDTDMVLAQDHHSTTAVADTVVIHRPGVAEIRMAHGAVGVEMLTTNVAAGHRPPALRRDRGCLHLVDGIDGHHRPAIQDPAFEMAVLHPLQSMNTGGVSLLVRDGIMRDALQGAGDAHRPHHGIVKTPRLRCRLRHPLFRGPGPGREAVRRLLAVHISTRNTRGHLTSVGGQVVGGKSLDGSAAVITIAEESPPLLKM